MQKKNVADQVFEEIMSSLLSGSYDPGEKLPSENELAENYGASRNTVRSALTKLNALGILETRKGEGTFFKGVGTNMYLHDFIPAILTGSEDLMGLMMFRRGVEISSARLAALNASDEDIAEMEQYFKHIEKNNVRGEAYAEATNSFHKKIAIASKNELLAKLLEVIGWILTSRMADFLKYKPDVEDSLYYHFMIFQCIKHHKEDEAAFMMDQHMSMLIERVRGYMEFCKDKSPE